MTKLNFANSYYKNKALTVNRKNDNHHSYIDAFFLLIKDLKIEDLSNLCKLIQQYYILLPNPIELSIEECYKLTQINNLTDVEKQIIVMLAEQCIKSGVHLGNNAINNGNINTSSWISHSFYASEVCANLSLLLNLDIEEAKTIGLLHDYGRKFNHTFYHAIEGFQHLIDINWDNEAIGCLTHSFVNGGRCSNNEQAVDGFYVDENGNQQWAENSIKDDITSFLENYQYTDYDIILTISDLMATDKGIVSPQKRIEDISTRRTIDYTNRGYFLTEITNTLINVLRRLNLINDNIKYIKSDKNTTLEEIQNYFNYVSTIFFNEYINININKKQNII